MEETNLPFDEASLACECVVTSLAFASQIIEAQKKIKLEPEQSQQMVSYLLETYALAWMDADGGAEA